MTTERHATHAKSMSPVKAVLLLTARPVASERKDATIIRAAAQVKNVDNFMLICVQSYYQSCTYIHSSF